MRLLGHLDDLEILIVPNTLWCSLKTSERWRASANRHADRAQGLAISLLFGVISSTLLTVLVIPAIYRVLRK